MSDSSTETLLAGDEVANHLILRVLEREEAGWVYLAEDPDGSRVRLRVISQPGLTDENVRARILQDLATLQALEHPNLARFLAYGEDDVVFYSLEHNGNATLFDLVYHRRALNGEELLWVARGLVSALSVLHEAGIPHGQLGATSVVLRDDGPVLVDLGLDTRLDPAYDPKQAMEADLLALQQVMGFAASGPGTDSGDETQALAASAARLINALSQANTIADAIESIDRIVEDSAKTGIDTQPALTDFMSLLEASDYSSGVYRRLDVPKTEVSEQILPASSVEGLPLGESDPDLDTAPTRVTSGSSKKSDLLTSQDVVLRDDSGRHVPVVDTPDAPDVSQEGGLFESEERTTPLVEAPEAYPRRLGDYVLLEEIGTGAGGTVHLARAKEAQNLVALRTLKPKSYKREEDLQKIWRKADAAASLEHPVFVRILDRGEVEGEAFLVNELLAGRNLDELAAQGVDIERGLLPQLLPVLEAVAEANEAGIVDGHLRANHVLIDGEGRPRLIDFGVGASLGRRPKSWVVGAPDPKDPSDDVESASLLVYHVATGGKTPPTEGWRVKLLGQPVPPSAFAAGLCPELDAVVLKALAEDRKARYPNVAALREDLERVLAGAVPVAPPLALHRRAGLWVVTHPVLAAAFALWAVCTLVFFFMALLSSPAPRDPTPPPPAAKVDLEKIETERNQAVAQALADAAQQLYRDGHLKAAIGPYGQALLLDPELEAARKGQAKTKRIVASRKEEHAQAQRDAARALQDAQSALDEGETETARKALESAADMQRLLLDAAGADQADAGLTAQLLRLEAELARLESGGSGGSVDPKALARTVRDRVAQAQEAAQEDRRQRAAQLAQQGDAALAKKDRATASQRYLDALALDPEHGDALSGLREALTPEMQAEGDGDNVAKWARNQRESLRADAERARSRGEHKRAEERLLQALAFAPRDPQLLAALEEVRKHLRSEQSAPVGDRVDAAVKRGEAALERARTATDRGDAALHFLTAQGELSAALALDPNRSDLAGELSKIKEDAVELFTPQVAEDTAPTRPDDPHLQFEEADQVAIARALGRKVRFAPPGNVFAKLREEINALGKGRFRVFLRLRTRAERVPEGSLQSVRVVARGFEVQLEDKQERVRWPWKFLAFKEGPYPRATRVERDGTIVIAPFFSAQPAATNAELERLRSLIRGLVEKALEADER